MRHVYSVIRFVPNPTRGEFVNVGILAGSEEAGEWAVQTISRAGRATSLDSTGSWPIVSRQIAEIAAILEEFTSAQEALTVTPDLPAIGEQWLEQLVDDWANMVQLSRPRPVVAESVDEVFELLWPELILESRTREFGITKRKAVAEVKRSFRAHKIDAKHINYRPTLRTANSHSLIDLAVHNGHVVHLTQCFSFQVADVERVLDEVKSWAWTIRGLRQQGGIIEVAEARLDVDKDVPVAAVYVAPTNDDSTFREADAAFRDQDVRAEVLGLDQVYKISEIAHEALEL